jgi:hypothetical protein
MSQSQVPTHTSGGAIDETRRDIERTRAELGHTVEALAAKADVKARVRGQVEHVKNKASDLTPASISDGSQGAVAYVRAHPVIPGLAIALIIGLVAGRLSRRS